MLLLDEGYARAGHVDGSSAYLAMASARPPRRGHEGRVVFHHGRLPCARRDRGRRGSGHTRSCGLLRPRRRGPAREPPRIAPRRLLAFSYPRARWYNRTMVALANGWRQLWRQPFRAYVHDPNAMTAVLERAGLRRRWSGGTWIWSVELFERSAS